MLPTGIFLVAGILVGRECYGPSLSDILVCCVPLLVVLILLTINYRRISMVLLMLFTMLLGMLDVSLSLSSLDVSLPTVEVEYDAVVTSEPVVHGKVVRMDMLLLSDNGTLPVRASLLRDTLTNDYTRLHVGSGIHAYSRIERRVQGLSTFIYYSNWLPASLDLGALSMFQRARLRLMSMRRGLSDVFADQAVARAMVLGDKSQLTKEMKDDYSVSGVSHLLALSGLHLGIIYALLSLVVFRLRRHFGGQVVILLAIWSYVVLVGMMPSVVRSACMLTVYSVAMALGRQRISVNSWALAAVVMLLVSPLSLWDVGFQMSFLAVLSILIVTPLLLRMPFLEVIRGNRVGRWLVDMLTVSLAAQVGTAPLVAHVFGRFATYGILLNLIAVPLAMLLVWVAVVCICVSWSPMLLSPLRTVLSMLGEWLNGIVSFVADLPGASVSVSLSLGQTISCYVLLLSLLLIAQFLLPHWGNGKIKALR